MSSFTNRLLEEILKNKKNNFTDNFDPMMEFDARYRKVISSNSLYEQILNARIPISCELPQKRRPHHALNPLKFYQKIVDSFKDMAFLYDLLCDSASKELLLKLLAYKILGYTKVKLPRNNSSYWDGINQMKVLEREGENLTISYLNLNLPLLDLTKLGYDLKANVTHAGAAAIFAQKQYEYKTADFILKANQGDVVLDCGACWGETSLYFSHEVGENGKVFSFEFIPENVAIFTHNLNYNPHLKDRIELVKHPVWEASDEDLFYLDHGPGSSISTTVGTQSNTQTCKTISIDDLVEQYKLEKLDLIKMDIEGAEMNALKGGIESIKKFQPKLAISLYHKPDDFITIPTFINNLGVEYEFYLDHHTIHFWETVLYAVPTQENNTSW